MATQNISATIGLGGEDGASVEINKAKKSLEALNKEAEGGGESAEKLGERLTEAGEKTEHLGHGVARLTRSMKSFAGESAGALGEMTHGLHGVTAIMSLLPGPIGLVGGAVAAAGIGMLAWREHIKEIEEETEKAKTKFEELGVPVEGIDPLLDEVRERAAKFGIGAKDATKRFVDELKSGNHELASMLGLMGKTGFADNFLKGMGVRAKESEAEVKQSVDSIQMALDVAQHKLEAAQTAAANTRAAMERGTAFERQLAKATGEDPVVQAARERVKSLVDARQEALGKLREIGEKALEAQRKEDGAAEAERSKSEMEGLRKDNERFLEQQRRKAEQHKKAMEEAKKHAEEMASRLRAQDAQHEANVRKDVEALENIQSEARKHAAQETANAADDPRIKAATLRAEVEAETAAKILDIHNRSFASEKQRADATKAVELDAAATKHRIADQEEKDLKALAEKKKKDADDDKKRLLDEEKRLQDRNISAVNSAKDMLDKLGMGKREDAAIDAAVAAYKAYGAIATGDGWAAANFTMEAIGAAAVAAGAGGGGSGGGVSAPSGGGSPAAPSTRATVGSAPGGGPTNTTIILQGGAYVGSMQGVGKALQVAVGSLKNTGITPAMGV